MGIDFNLLTNPLVLIVVIMIGATAVALTLAVVKNLQSPTKQATLDEALRSWETSELDIDTALNKTDDEKKRLSWFEYWAAASNRTGKVIADPNTPGRTALGLAIFAGLAGFLFAPGPGIFGIVAGAAIGLLGYKTVLGMEERKRIIAMERQLPLLLSGLRANLQAGATPQSAIIAVADDLPSPLGDELRILKRDLGINVVLEDALQSLSSRVPSREMKFLVSSMEIAIRSGANLDPQLETIQGIVTQRTRIRQKLAAAVAQAKPTKWLALGAVPLMFFVSLTNKENTRFWFGDGIIWLLGAIGLYLAGAFCIRAMVRSVENA